MVTVSPWAYVVLSVFVVKASSPLVHNGGSVVVVEAARVVVVRAVVDVDAAVVGGSVVVVSSAGVTMPWGSVVSGETDATCLVEPPSWRATANTATAMTTAAAVA